MLTAENKKDIISVLEKFRPGAVVSEITETGRITGGADTEIIAFKAVIDNETIDLVIRLFRRKTVFERAKAEHEVLQFLFSAKLKVPEPYGYMNSECSFGCRFLLMEKINGELLSGAYMNKKISPDVLFYKFVKNLAGIHNTGWDKAGDKNLIPDIDADPYIIIKNVMTRSEKLAEQWEVSEFRPLLDWLYSNMKSCPCEELVIVHGDYHAMNIIMDSAGELYTIDWSNVHLGDFRTDLAFASFSVESGAGFPMTKMMSDMYEKESGRQVNGIDFFIVLSGLFNFLRIYSMINNYEITGENDHTKKTMLADNYAYSSCLLKKIKETTGLSFPSIEKGLK